MTTQLWTLRHDVIATDVTDSIVALDLDAGSYYGFESTGRRIWQLLEEPQSVDSLVAILTEEYDVSVERCATSVGAFLAELESLTLIVPATDPV
jgi:hypothetical protein